MKLVKERRTFVMFDFDKGGNKCKPYKRLCTREFFFDNGEWVNIDLLHEAWEYEKNDDEETYISGMIEFFGYFVIGFDGCYELPEAVVTSLKIVYKRVDL